MKKHLEIKLKRLWTGEIAAVVVFLLCYFQLPKLSIGSYLMKSTAYPLFTLSLILVQGAFYWWILYKRLTTVNTFTEKVGQIYRILKLVDIALLCLGIPVMVLTHSYWFSTIIGVVILLFAIVEWVNYYVLRLSYSLNPFALFKKIKNRTLVKSKLAKEIENR